MSGHNILSQLAQGLGCRTVTAAGTTQSGATPVEPGFTTTAGTGTEGVILPQCEVGTICIIKNTGAGNLKVYPDTGSAINAGSANAALTMATVTSCILVRTGALQWQSIPTVPS